MMQSVAVTWFKIALSKQQVKTGHLERIRETFADVFIARGAPAGAAMFSGNANDTGQTLYFNALAANLAETLLKDNGAIRCLPPLDDGGMTLLVGHEGDERLLRS